MLDLTPYEALLVNVPTGPYLVEGVTVWKPDWQGVNYFTAQVQHAGPDSAPEHEREAIAALFAASPVAVANLIAEVKRLHRIEQILTNDAVQDRDGILGDYAGQVLKHAEQAAPTVG